MRRDTSKSLDLAQEVARAIIEDKSYKEMLIARANAGQLQPAVETMLWHYAFGKPVEHIDVSIPQEDLSTKTEQELLDRAEEIRRHISARITDKIAAAQCAVTLLGDRGAEHAEPHFMDVLSVPKGRVM